MKKQNQSNPKAEMHIRTKPNQPGLKESKDRISFESKNLFPRFGGISVTLHSGNEKNRSNSIFTQILEASSGTSN